MLSEGSHSHFEGYTGGKKYYTGGAATAKDCFGQHTLVINCPWHPEQLLQSQQSFVNATSVEEGRTQCFVARGGGISKGICGTADFCFKQKQSVLISNVFVTPRARGQGLAKRLIQAIEEEARDQGANRLVLEVYTSNTPAYTLYQRNDFTTNGIHAVLAQISKFTGFPFLVEMEKSLT